MRPNVKAHDSAVGPRSILHRLTVLTFTVCGLGGPAHSEEYPFPDPDGYGNSTDPRYTAVRIYAGGKAPVLFFYDIHSKRSGWHMWRQVNIGDVSFASPVNVHLNSGIINPGNAYLMAALQIGSLDLTQVRVTLNNLTLLLEEPDSTLSMRNSSLILSGQANAFGHAGPGSLSIRALSGENSIERGTGTSVNSATHITVAPGSSLAFRDFYRSNATSPRDHLRFGSANTTMDVDAGRLILERSRIYVDAGVAHFRNGAELFVTGSEWAGGYIHELRFKDSRLNMDHLTRVTAHTLTFDRSRVDLGGNAELSATSVGFFGGNQIFGPPPQSQVASAYIKSFAKFDVVSMAPRSALHLVDVGQADFKSLLMTPDSLLQLDRTTMYSSQVDLRGGRMEMGQDGQLVLLSALQDNRRLTNALYSAQAGSGLLIQPTGWLSIGKGARAIIDDQAITVTNNGGLQARGHLSGDGAVLGTGTILIRHGGAIEPGSVSAYGTLHLDNHLIFEATLPGDELPRVMFHIPASGATPTRPLITYGPRPVVYEGKPVVEVHGTGSLSADALAGKSITVIAAQSASAAGTIQTNGLTPTVRPVDMPALLSYTVGDTGTHGKPDVTLFMDKLPVTDLQKHPALTSKNRQGTANLLVAAATTNPSITSALNTVTNEQLSGTAAGQPTGFLDQIHAEPYSSFTTVNLEAIANLRNLVFMQALDTDPRGQRFWLDTVESRGDINGQQGLGSFGYGLSSLTVGKDLGSWRGAAWGAYLSMGQARMDEHDIVNQRLKGHTTSAGLYGQWRHAGWEGRLLLGYGQGQQESTRQLNLPNTSQTVTGRYGSRSWQAGVRLSMGALQWRALELRPEIGGSLTTWRQAGFTEAGSASYALQVAGMSTGTRIVHAGLNASLPRLWAGVPVRPVGFLRLEHDFAKSREHAVQAALATQPGNAQRFNGQGRGPSTATAALGLVSDAPGAWQVGGGLAFSQHTHGSEWSAGLRVKVTW